MEGRRLVAAVERNKNSKCVCVYEQQSLLRCFFKVSEAENTQIHKRVTRMDTFSDVPREKFTSSGIHDLFEPFKNLTGVIFTGIAVFPYNDPNESRWGEELNLTQEETLQIRVYPKGLMAKDAPPPKGVVMIAARRRGSSERDHVSLAFLWDSNVHAGFLGLAAGRSGNDLLQGMTTGCRNLPIIMPSLFNHHDACAYLDEGRLVCKWPVLDTSNYHALRPTSLTITQLPSTGFHCGNMRYVAATGMSKYIIAAHFAGGDVEDVLQRACESVPYRKWVETKERYQNELEKIAQSKQKATAALQNATIAMDVMSCEGLLAILSHTFASGALPDHLHLPTGFPLLIAFAVRLACYPKRYGLLEHTPADAWGAQELISLFESSWTPIAASGGETGFYAIDSAIKIAYKDAFTTAGKMHTRQAVIDHLSYWYRSGMRCISSVFGPQLDGFLPVMSPYGRCDRLQNPLEEARLRVLRKKLDAIDSNPFSENSVALNNVKTADKKHMLLVVLNSVEGWLRSGCYAGQQLSIANNPGASEAVKVPRVVRKEEFTRILNLGVEKSVQEMLQAGEVNEESEARAAADAVRETIESVLSETREDAHVMLAVEEPEAPKPTKQKDVMLDPDVFCLAAMSYASSGIAAALFQGALVHHQLSIGAYLSAPSAVNTCADCSAQVHVLPSLFLSSRHATCPRCGRRRCSTCEGHAARFFGETNQLKGTVDGCLHCKHAPGSTAPPPLSPTKTTATGSTKKRR